MNQGFFRGSQGQMPPPHQQGPFGGKPQGHQGGGKLPGFDDPTFAAPEENNDTMLWDAASQLAADFGDHQQKVSRIMGTIRDLQRTLESTRVAYNEAIKERDAKRTLLVAAEGRLADVQRVVQRYTVVQDPVVASDGYTYERAVIKQYLDECEQSETHAYSQQTKEVLSDVLVQNQSLKKLVELLKTVKQTEIPVLSQRAPIAPITGPGAGGGLGAQATSTLNWLEEDDDDQPQAKSAKPERAIHASDLEAAFTGNAPGGGSGSAGGQGSKRGDDRRGGDRDNERRHGGRSDPPPSSSSRQDSRGGGGGKDDSVRAPRGGPTKDRDGGMGGGGGGGSRLHPCLRVYGFCNFKDDCTFAKYPYDACLNNIKGKCRFGAQCKELHVNPADPKFQNPRSASSQQSSSSQGQQQSSSTAPPAPRSQQREKKDRDE